MTVKLYTNIDGQQVELKYDKKRKAFIHPPIKATQAKAQDT